ncbi:MAG TPA: IS200/IS605 family transposase, partial [Deltaproteobacteria bacterium]|nr:IS200/IS605 family transposase [Deltaproteobacteria bacterium]
MRLYRVGAHTKTDLKVHLIWIPKYRKKVLTGTVA